MANINFPFKKTLDVFTQVAIGPRCSICHKDLSYSIIDQDCHIIDIVPCICRENEYRDKIISDLVPELVLKCFQETHKIMNASPQKKKIKKKGQ